MSIDRRIFTEEESTAEKVKGYLLAAAIGVVLALAITRYI